MQPTRDIDHLTSHISTSCTFPNLTAALKPSQQTISTKSSQLRSHHLNMTSDTPKIPILHLSPRHGRLSPIQCSETQVPELSKQQRPHTLPTHPKITQPWFSEVLAFILVSQTACTHMHFQTRSSHKCSDNPPRNK